jgi:hypothetical protein
MIIIKAFFYTLFATLIICMVGGIIYYSEMNKHTFSTFIPTNFSLPAIKQVEISPTVLPPTATPAQPTPTKEIPANWKKTTDIKGNYNIQYPPQFYFAKLDLYRADTPEIYIADSAKTVQALDQGKDLTNDTIIIRPIDIIFTEDTKGHSPEDILAKIANRMGTEKTVTGSIPWINSNGGANDGKIYYYSAPFTKLTIDGQPAVRVKAKDTITYIFSKNGKYFSISAAPIESTYMSEFDLMVSTIKFLKK